MYQETNATRGVSPVFHPRKQFLNDFFVWFKLALSGQQVQRSHHTVASLHQVISSGLCKGFKVNIKRNSEYLLCGHFDKFVTHQYQISQKKMVIASIILSKYSLLQNTLCQTNASNNTFCLSNASNDTLFLSYASNNILCLSNASIKRLPVSLMYLAIHCWFKASNNTLFASLMHLKILSANLIQLTIHFLPV